MSRSKKNDLTSYPQWNKLPVGLLVHATAEYVVFLDAELEIDWETSAGYDSANRFPDSWGTIQNRAAELEQCISPYAPRTVRRSAARMIGEGLARGLDGDTEAATDALDKATTFVLDRNREVGRLFRLTGAGLTWIALSAVCVPAWLFRDYVRAAGGETALLLILCAGAGATGALLSVVLNMVSRVPDANAARALQYLEASARVIAGAIAAIVAVLAVRAKILLPQIEVLPDRATLLAVVGIIAGFSERLVPDLVKKLEVPGGR